MSKYWAKVVAGDKILQVKWSYSGRIVKRATPKMKLMRKRET